MNYCIFILKTLILCCSCLGLFVSSASAQIKLEDISAEFEYELKYFPNSPIVNSNVEHFQNSFAFSGEAVFGSEDGEHNFVFSPFARIDLNEKTRSNFDVKEAYYQFLGDNFDITAGVFQEYWGIVESNSVVNVINQAHLLEDIDEDVKLGQPLVKLSIFGDSGMLDLFYLASFRNRSFSDAQGRLRTAIPIDEDDVVFNFQGGRMRPSFAARYSNNFGSTDLSISAFHGVGREPDFILSESLNSLRPVYSIVTQLGLELQHSVGSWLLKFEGMGREGQGKSFFAGVAGFEYTLSQPFKTDWDIGLVSEYLFDGRDEFSFSNPNVNLRVQATPAPPTFFDNDLFLGTRLTFNDTQDTTALIGAVLDLNDGSTFLSAEAKRRVGKDLVIQIEGRFFSNINAANNLNVLRDDDHLVLRIKKYF